MRIARYRQSFRKELLSLSHASGYEHAGLFCGKDVEFSVDVNRFVTLDEVTGYQKTPVPFESMTALEDSPKQA